MKIVDEFRGDNDLLLDCIVALIRMNDDGVLAPHGIGGHARGLLAACYVRLKKCHKTAISCVGSGKNGPHVIYLREGKRITVGRDRKTRGPAWLVIDETPIVMAHKGGWA